MNAVTTRIIRVLDLSLSLVGLIAFLPIGAVIVLIGYFDTGSPVFVQERVGKNMQSFRLYKFRTMKIGTQSVATHLVNSNSTTKLGALLRRTKLDELPQLWNVFIGNMSLVGPRPNLLNQDVLIQERTGRGVYNVRPGITGLAQILEIDMSTPELLANVDARMIKAMTISKYFKIIFLTILGRGSGDRIVVK